MVIVLSVGKDTEATVGGRAPFALKRKRNLARDQSSISIDRFNVEHEPVKLDSGMTNPDVSSSTNNVPCCNVTLIGRFTVKYILISTQSVVPFTALDNPT